MSDCFTPTPDFTPFLAVANRVPLDRMNPNPKKVADRQLRLDAIASDRLPAGRAGPLPRGCPQPHPLARHEWPPYTLSRVGRQACAR